MECDCNYLCLRNAYRDGYDDALDDAWRERIGANFTAAALSATVKQLDDELYRVRLAHAIGDTPRLLRTPKAGES